MIKIAATTKIKEPKNSHKQLQAIAKETNVDNFISDIHVIKNTKTIIQA